MPLTAATANSDQASIEYARYTATASPSASVIHATLTLWPGAMAAATKPTAQAKRENNKPCQNCTGSQKEPSQGVQ